MFFGTYNLNPQTLPDGGQAPLQVDSTGRLLIAGGNANGSQLAAGQVVTGDQSYAVGSINPLNQSPDGRLKVGLSAAGNITPAARLTTNNNALLTAGIYLATRPVWSDGFTGALQVNARGNLCTIHLGGEALTTGQVAVPANTATQVVAARAGRQRVTLSPTTSAAFYQGGANTVSATTGLFVPAGGSKTTDTGAALWVFSTTAITMSFEELY